MSKKVLVLKGSARKTGNTAILADEFIRGAKQNGNEVIEVSLKEKNVKDCLGCGACQGNGGMCVQKDDMPEIYENMKNSDVIVFASPVYFYTWTSLMKRTIDRTFAVESILNNKTFYLISAGAAPEEKWMETMINSFNQYISCFRAEGNKNGGYLFGCGTNAPGDVKGTEAITKAYNMGLNA